MLDVYVGNLPARVSANDLRELFDGVSGQNLFGLKKDSGHVSLIALLLAHVPWAQNFLSHFRKKPQAAELDFTMVYAAQGQSSRYCRVSGYSRSSANQLIAQLEGAGLQGRVLDVRAFYPRNLTNDRRRAGWRFHRWLGVERRANERRFVK